MTVAQDVLHPRLAALHRELLLSSEEIRGRVPDAVHRSRVACRRLRAALGSFGLLLEPVVTRPARSELRWAARALGEARDTEVAHARLVRLMDDLDVAVDGPDRGRLGDLHPAREADAQVRVVETIASARYAHLLAALERLVLDPPWTAAAGLEVGAIAPSVIRRDLARLERRVARVGATTVRRRDAALHDVRKAAKRLRYAGETVEPVWPEEARWVVETTTRITRALGERQDTVLTRRLLDELAASASAAGESTGRFGQLRSLEGARAAECEVAFEDAWRGLSRPERWVWLG